MLSTVTGPLTLDVTGELPGALHLLLLGAAPAELRYHLEAGRTVSSVTSFRAVVAAASENLSARIPAGGGRLHAGQHVVGLPARAVPNQGQRTRGAFTFSVTYTITAMESALE